MKKNALVFSIVREQSMFMTVVISVLTFLSVLALGIALSIGTGVMRWNMGWEKYATVQIVNSENAPAIKKIFEENANKIESVKKIFVGPEGGFAPQEFDAMDKAGVRGLSLGKTILRAEVAAVVAIAKVLDK